MKFNIATTSDDVRDALDLISSHFDRSRDDGDSVLPVANKVFLYLLLTLNEVLDPFEDTDILPLIEDFDDETLDQIIALILRLATDPLIKPLLKHGKISDISIYNTSGKCRIILESNDNGHTRTIPTIKASLF